MARAKTTRKKKTQELESQSDPHAPLDGAVLLKAAAPVLKVLREDLLARAESSPAVGRALEAQHAREKAARRTGEAFKVWRRLMVEQVAAGWFLSCVFVRTLEDRGLLDKPRLAGPHALDSQRQFSQLAPSLSEREYLLTVFRELARLPAAKELFDARHNPVWRLAPSAEGARALLELFRKPDVEAPGFRFGQADTRFLGDLYQDLSEDVRKRYALLQTPRFVESFILDQTLEPAIEKFGLDEVTLLDPTCGSGHFLLGAFERLLDRRLATEPGLDVREAAKKALDAVYGTDINPYAVAIARFRLTLAYLERAGFTRLADAPALPIHLAVADSLLHREEGQKSFGEVGDQDPGLWMGDVFDLEDPAAARDALYRRHAAVVGNPPYITPKDGTLRAEYAKRYSSCRMNYALSVPFCQRFFELARDGGYVGQITANSFMKREFGKKLVEDVLPTLNVTDILNTSGAYIPGHGTPTVLLFGTNEAPQSDKVQAVLANRGEPTTPEDPAKGHVWSSVAEHHADVGFENEYITVAEVGRDTLKKHPWSLGGGGAAELMELLESRAARRLEDAVDCIGFSVIIGEDDIFLRPRHLAEARDLPHLPIVLGEQIRDWALRFEEVMLRPFDPETLEVGANERLLRELWPFKTVLEERIVSGSTSMKQAGRAWYDVRRLSRDKHQTPLSITFAFVATHNHFVLDRGGKVFNRSAPIIKLPEGATEDDHLALLAYLNSSVAQFFLRQVCHCKGAQGVNEGHKAEEWEQFLEYSGAMVGRIPLAPNWRRLAPLAACIQRHADEFEDVMPRAQIERWAMAEPAGEVVRDFGTAPRDALMRLVALQEELDWEVYSLFGLLDETSRTELGRCRAAVFEAWSVIDHRASAPWAGEIAAGHRAFEQRLDPSRTAWFARNSYQVPAEGEIYGAAVEALLAWRLNAIGRNQHLALIERPENKHRWGGRDPAAEAEQAVADWALKTIELRMADAVTSTAGAACVGWLREEGHRAETVTRHYFPGGALAWVRAAMRGSATPFLAAYRYTELGLEKRAVWEHTWDLQRREDAGEDVGKIPVPPKYAQKDFRSATYWRLRGKLDVPKERFISYPGCESDQDGEPVYGWAGWNHLEQAQALAALYQARKTEEGWGADRLTPMLAGLLELLPWIKQWHNEPSDDFGGMRLGDYFEQFLEGQCSELGLSHDDLRAWRPAATGRKARGGKRA